MTIIVSGVAIGQWKSVTKNGGNLTKVEAETKILQAIILGKPVFMYKSNDYIIRYFDLNILISSTGVVLTVWRHEQAGFIHVSEGFKNSFKQHYGGYNDYKVLAESKHHVIMCGGFKIPKQGKGVFKK